MSPDVINIYADFRTRNVEEDGIRLGGKNLNSIKDADDATDLSHYYVIFNKERDAFW